MRTLMMRPQGEWECVLELQDLVDDRHAVRGKVQPGAWRYSDL